MKRTMLALLVGLAVVAIPGRAAAGPITLLFGWDSWPDVPSFQLTLEVLAAPTGLPADFAAEVTLGGPYDLQGQDPFCGQSQRVQGSTLAFCSLGLMTAGLDLFGGLDTPTSALLIVVFTGDSGDFTTLTARLESPGTALVDYQPQYVPEPATILLLTQGLAAVAVCRRRRSR